MATPPFNINENLPGDTDIVSQHPANARQMRDIVESWLRVNHDTSGNHFRIDIPRGAAPGTPAASIDVLYMSSTGRLKIIHPDATEEFVGVPPGNVVFTSGAIDTGYLAADGSAVSRVTFAELFVKIGINHGAGDGSTTFNLPDIKGRVIAGIDTSSLRLSASFFGSTPNIAAVGGLESALLIQSNIPNVQIGVTGALSVTSTRSDVIVGNFSNFFLAGGASSVGVVSMAGGSPGNVQLTSTGSLASGLTASLNGGVAQTSFNNVQPTIILRPQIKF